MGNTVPFSPEKLVMGVMVAEELDPQTVWRLLEQEFGPIDYKGEFYPFSFTRYYEPEMGGGVRKCLVSFERKIDPQTLPAVKRRTNELEARRAIDGNRRFNLDPGILDLNRFILATTKNRGHRIPLEGAVYAELTLLFIRGRFEPLPWTYADYRTETVQNDLQKMRKTLKTR